MNITREPFIFVRHGKTDWSLEQLTLGPADHPLNKAGEQQALAAANKLKQRQEEFIIISSSLCRAAQTAEIIAYELKVPMRSWPDLHERYYGDFKESKSKIFDDTSLPYDAETQESFEIRIERVFGELLKINEMQYQRKIIVSHGQVFKYLSLLLANQEMRCDYGEVFLFDPLNNEDAWDIVKL